MENSNKSIYSGWAFRLIVINIILYLIQIFAAQYHVVYSFQGATRTGPSVLTHYLGLTPALILQKGYVWQVFTYMFLHDTYSFVHVFFNMYALFMFGLPVENAWGGRRFLSYYLFCGTFAGICIFLINLINQGGASLIPTIGASGAVFGLLLAFGILFPDAELLIFFILPIKAKYLVILYGALELFLELSGGEGNVSHIGHLGGLAGGLIFFFLANRKLIKFKYKISKAKRHNKKIRQTVSPAQGEQNKININNRERQAGILKKVRESGIEALSDDDIQYIKYLEIMAGDLNKAICNEVDFNMDDPHCRDCEHFTLCFLREIKKYL